MMRKTLKFLGGATLVVTGLLVSASCMSQPHAIERVEPPNWWLGFQDPELQLVVYGPRVSELKPSVQYPGVSISRVERVDSPNYLFLYLDIAGGTEPGSFDIVFEGESQRLVHVYRLDRKNPDPEHARGFTAEDAIYLLTPDRFANGNPDNDNQPGYADAMDRSELCGRHGGDIAGIASHLDYISELGFTAIWLNPVLENAMDRCSYHGYSTTDFYRVDPRYGSNDEYRALSEKARSMGVGLIMDMIVNHIGSGHWWMKDLPTSDWLNRPRKRSITNHIHATVQDPYASDYDLREFADGWFVDTMPDLNQRNPLLGDYLVQNALWWIETLGLSGIRMDTHPYPDRDYMGEWTRRVMEEYPEFNIVGEEWNGNPVIVSYWQRGKKNRDGYVSHLPSLMDFPLQEKMARSLASPKPDWGSSWMPLYETLAQDTVYPDPFNLVVFPDNHDMSRIFTQLGEDLDLWRMAMVYVATMRGIPQIYYGTEILMRNRDSNDHGLIRSDFPGGWEGDHKNAFSGEGLDDEEREAQLFTRKLLEWRQGARAVHGGRLMQFAPFGEVYAYFRYDERDTVMVIMNKNHEVATIDPARFAERFGDATRGVDVLTGAVIDITATFEVPARGVLLLEIE